MFKVDW